GGDRGGPRLGRARPAVDLPRAHQGPGRQACRGRHRTSCRALGPRGRGARGGSGMSLRPVDDATYRELAAGVPLPIEQAPVWAAFDAVVEGRSHWGRLAFDDDGAPAAVLSLAEVRGPGGFR